MRFDFHGPFRAHILVTLFFKTMNLQRFSKTNDGNKKEKKLKVIAFFHKLIVIIFSSSCRGLISLNSSDTYYLEPISGVDLLQHSLLSADKLSVKGGSCGHSRHTIPSNHISNLFRSFHPRVSLPHIILLLKNMFRQY